MKTFKFMALTICTLLMSVTFSSCNSDDESESNSNPFVGVWEDSYGHITEFKSNGEFNQTLYFAEDWTDFRSGTYSYNKNTMTLLYVHSAGGLKGHSELFRVEYISTGKIVYIDPDDLITTTLTKIR